MQIRAALSIVAVLVTATTHAQRHAPVVSPEIHDDQTVTFRLRAPDAKSVELSGQFLERNQALNKGENGLWSITVGPIKPDLYPYNFVADGIGLSDPSNQYVFPNEGFKPSLVDVPGDVPSIYAVQDVPHGKVTYHFYPSNIIGGTRPLLVYTPPGYDSGNDSYPVFYLVSGTTDTEETWFKAGQVNFILDNLIAAGKAVPMIVVMPNGNMGVGTPRPHTLEAAKMYQIFADELIESIFPYVETNYRIRSSRENRAIAGFSRGGGQSLFTGFAHIDKFAHIGSYSAYLTPEVFDLYFSELSADADATNQKLETLWLGVGKGDFLYEPAITFMDFLETKDIDRHTLVTEGGHTWMNARHYLHETLQLFFEEHL